MFNNYLKCEPWDQVFSSDNTNRSAMAFISILRKHFDTVIKNNKSSYIFDEKYKKTIIKIY